jgi:hypothetical protein
MKMKPWFFVLGGGCGCGSVITAIGFPLFMIVIAVSLIPSCSFTARGDYTQTGPLSYSSQWSGQKNETVVNAALDIASTLYACGTNQHYQCYTSTFPQDAKAYLDQACGNCSLDKSGDFQCVMFILAVYWEAKQTLPYGPDAVLFWNAYQHASGWEEVSSNAQPLPGDIAIWAGPSGYPAGHVAIVIDVGEPVPGHPLGFVQIAQANGLKSVEMLTLTLLDGSYRVDPENTDLAGFDLLGYIRHPSFVH